VIVAAALSLLCLAPDAILFPAEFSESGGPERIYRLACRESQSITVDGKASETAWQTIPTETGFGAPWESHPAPSTSFRAFHSGEYLYFLFQASDPDIIITAGAPEEVVASGDRVELFFSRDPEMKDYYCLEIDPRGKVLDYRASFYRRFDNSWDLAGLRTAGSLTGEGYTVEAAIPVSWLEESGLSGTARRDGIFAGIYRAEFSRAGDGGISESWITWKDPGSRAADFHIPSSLGLLILESCQPAR